MPPWLECLQSVGQRPVTSLVFGHWSTSRLDQKELYALLVRCPLASDPLFSTQSLEGRPRRDRHTRPTIQSDSSETTLYRGVSPLALQPTTTCTVEESVGLLHWLSWPRTSRGDKMAQRWGILGHGAPSPVG